MKKDRVRVVIIGCKGTAGNIIHQITDAIVNYDLNWEIAGICIDEPPPGSFYTNIKILEGLKDINRLIKKEALSFIFALFKPTEMRERFLLMESLNIPSEKLATFIHPKAYVSQYATLGKGNVIMSNSTVQSGVKIGNNNIINSNVTLEHDTNTGNFNFFAAGSSIGSETMIGNFNFFGLNSCLREKTTIGNCVFAGMGSVITESFSDAMIYGVPARKISDWK
jgi:sugar O-acyltransferase (sialic acid O-acetyltransferase NeuD family)